MERIPIFGERLTELMFEQRVSNKDLSKAVGASITTICRWKLGQQRIFLSNLIKLAEFFNCSIDFLVGRTESILDFIPHKCPSFYERLRQVMSEKQITRYRIAKETNIGDDYFTTWKNGSDPHILSLIQLADYLKCTIDYLVGREG